MDDASAPSPAGGDAGSSDGDVPIHDVDPVDASPNPPSDWESDTSDLGLTPNSDGKAVRLNIPPLSVEQRKKLVGRVKDLAEEARVSIRNIRRDANKQADVEQGDKILTEDDVATCKEQIQALTKRFEG